VDFNLSVTGVVKTPTTLVAGETQLCPSLRHGELDGVRRQLTLAGECVRCGHARDDGGGVEVRS
jgi:uncharacterized protein (DUF983 family)